MSGVRLQRYGLRWADVQTRNSRRSALATSCAACFPARKKKLAIPLLCQLWQNWPGLKAGSIRFFNVARLAGIKTTEGYEFEQFGKMKKYIYRVTMSTSDKNIDSSTCFLSIFLCEL